MLDTSCKCHDELEAAQATEIEHMLAIDELETRKEDNQICTLKPVGDFRWGSYFHSIFSLVRMFGATC